MSSTRKSGSNESSILVNEGKSKVNPYNPCLCQNPEMTVASGVSNLSSDLPILNYGVRFLYQTSEMVVGFAVSSPSSDCPILASGVLLLYRTLETLVASEIQNLLSGRDSLGLVESSLVETTSGWRKNMRASTKEKGWNPVIVVPGSPLHPGRFCRLSLRLNGWLLEARVDLTTEGMGFV